MAQSSLHHIHDRTDAAGVKRSVRRPLGGAPGPTREWLLFESALFVVFTMYGGGFATIPDIFGVENVGAIHGAVLTARSAAAVVGPVIIGELSNRARAALPSGASKVHIYDKPLQVLAAMLAVGFVLTLLVRPLRAHRP